MTRVIAFVLALLVATLARGGAITLHADAVLTPGARVITIADVALVDVADRTLHGAVSGAVLRLTPDDAAASGAVTVTIADIEQALRDADLRMSGLAITGSSTNLRLHPRDAAARHLLRRDEPEAPEAAWQTTTELESRHPILSSVLATVASDLGLPLEDVRVRMDPGAMLRLESVPASSRFLAEQVTTARSSRAVFRVTLTDEDADRRPFNIALDLETRRPLLVLTEDIRRHQPITPDLFTVESQWRSPSATEPLTQEAALLHPPLAKSALREGEVLTEANTEPPILVTRRQAVRVYAHTDGITVRIDAIALDEGAKGDLIRCKPLSAPRNSRDERIFLARVTGAGELAFQSPSVD